MKKNLLTLIIGAVLIVIFALLLFVFQVRKSEVAVVTRFGRVAREKSDPGAYGRLPWPIENVDKLDQRIQNFEDAASETYTADSITLVMRVYVGWRITDAKTFFPKFAGGSVASAEKMLKDIVSQAKIAVAGKHPLGDFINANATDLKFDTIEREIRLVAEAQLRTNNCDIGIEYLEINKLGLPESVTATVFERMTEERKGLAAKLLNEGEAEAKIIRSAADRVAAEKVSSAEAEARQIIGRGQVVAAELLPVFQQNPELATFLLKTEALESSLKEHAILIFDTRTSPFDLFNSPSLNKAGK